MSSETIPPSRARRWPIVLVFLVVFGALAIPSIVRSVEGQSSDQVASRVNELWIHIAEVSALVLLFMWLFYLPSRRLIRGLRKSGFDSPIAIYSSSELEGAIKELNGTVVGSHSMPATAFLAFVDLGPKFEIWRWHHGRPQCVVRMRWTQITSIELGTVSHFTTVDRAIVLNALKNGRKVSLAISPQNRHLVRMLPMKDHEFVATLRHFRMRLESSRPPGDADSHAAYSHLL